MVMLSPVLERLNEEGLKKILERVFNMAVRAKIIRLPHRKSRA